MEANNENVIEWISGQTEITCTFTQTKWVNKAKSLQEKHPDKVKIIDINKDGSIAVKLPLKALKLSIIEKTLTDEQRQELAKKFVERINKEN